MSAANVLQGAELSFNRSAGVRTLVLAVIVGLHAGVLLYLALFRPVEVTPPKVETVLMTQLIAEPAPARPVTPPAPPVSEPAPKPPSIRPVAKHASPAPKPVVKTAIAPPVAVTNSPQAAPSQPDVAATPSQSEAAPAPAVPSAAQPPAAVQATTPPRFNAAYLNNPPPAYPPMARRMGEEGKVVLRVFVTPQGTAGEVHIQTSSGSPLFDDAAREAVRQWRFVPARQGDSSIAAWVQVPIVFRLG